MAFVSAITDAGIAAALAAESHGALIDINSATFSSDLLTPTISALEAITTMAHVVDTEAVGSLSYHMIDSATLMVRVNLAPGVGPFTWGSYSLNLSDGTPFVVGTWTTLQTKDLTTTRYVEETINFSNAAAVINLTILNTIDAALPEVPDETGLPTPASSAYPVYFVHAHTQFNNRPALAMRLTGGSPSWYFLDASIITNSGGTSVTETDDWSPNYRFRGGGVSIENDSGEWSSANYGKNVLIKSARNPAIGIADHTGSNWWALVNSSGSLFLAAMPPTTDIVTGPVNAFILDRSGNLVTTASIAAATGNITADNGKLRAGVGAYLSGDGNAATILDDFTRVDAGSHKWTILPDGTIEQTVYSSADYGGGLVSTVIPLGITYPTIIMDAVVCFSGSTPPGPSAPGSISIAPTANGSVTVTTDYTDGNLTLAVGPLGIIIRSSGY